MNQISYRNTVFKFFLGAGKGKAVCIVVIYLCVSLAPSFLLILNRTIFDTFSNVFSLRLVSGLLLSYMIIQIVSKVLAAIQKRLMTVISHDIRTKMQREVQEKMMRVQYLELDNPDTFDLIQRVSNHIPGQCASAVFLVFDLVGMAVQILTAITILADIHFMIPVILTVFTVPYIFLYRKMCFDNYFREVNQGKEYRKNWYLIRMLFDKHYNKELKVYDCFGYLGDKEKGINEKLHHESYVIARKYALLGILLDIVKSVGKAACMMIAVALIVYKDVSISAFTVLMQAMDSMQACLMDIFAKIRDIGALRLSMEDYQRFHRLAEEPRAAGQVQLNEKEPIIALKNVNFSYPTKKSALKDVTLTIHEGEKIAIVGKNGSGKTTLINVLLGFYRPLSGEIQIGETALEDCIADFRSRTVYIMQNMPKYILSIGDNIKMGRDIVAADVINVLGIDRMIDHAPDGGQTLLGEENDNPYNLSGGEWSRLGIARNAQKEDPIVYIMDEPTAALDPVAESKIFESFDRITKGKTTIFISHRLGMVSLADRIIVLDGGMIAEQGTHIELMERKGLYHDMYCEQIQLYER